MPNNFDFQKKVKIAAPYWAGSFDLWAVNTFSFCWLPTRASWENHHPRQYTHWSGQWLGCHQQICQQRIYTAYSLVAPTSLTRAVGGVLWLISAWHIVLCFFFRKPRVHPFLIYYCAEFYFLYHAWEQTISKIIMLTSSPI